MADHDSLFQINDIVLDIAPENILIDRSAQLRSLKPLRTRGSALFRSPHSVINIVAQCKFVGTDQINQQLRPLIAQFRLTPFCYVDNQFLRDSVLGNEENRTAIMLALQNLTVSTAQNLPDTWNVTFNFIWFNYKPYANNLRFKESILGNDQYKAASSPKLLLQTRDDKKMSPFQLFYQNELNKLSPVRLEDSNFSLGQLEFLLTENPPENLADSTSLINYAGLRDLEEAVLALVNEAESLVEDNPTDATDNVSLKQLVAKVATRESPDRVSLRDSLNSPSRLVEAIHEVTKKAKEVSPNN
jgi:hypothetical protein